MNSSVQDVTRVNSSLKGVVSKGNSHENEPKADTHRMRHQHAEGLNEPEECQNEEGLGHHAEVSVSHSESLCQNAEGLEAAFRGIGSAC